MIMDLIQNSETTDNEILSHLETCLACRGCETVCPSGVEYYSAFQNTVKSHKLKQPKSVLSKLILHGIKNRIWLSGFTKILYVGKKLGIFKLFSKFNFDFAIQGKAIPDFPLKNISPGIHKTNSKSKGSAGLYVGCIMNEWFKKDHFSTISVLNKLGYDVFVPEVDICCGALHQHSGDSKSAEFLKTKSYKQFQDCDFVIVNSAGCSAELKSSFESGIKYLDIIEFISSQNLKIMTNFTGKIVWDSPCHLSHAQKLNHAPLEIFKKLGINPINWQGQELCCGGAGNYSLNNLIESEEILNFKMEQLSNLEFDYLITSNPGCFIQLQKGNQKYGQNFKIYNLVEFVNKLI